MKRELREFFPKWSENETITVTLTMKQHTQGQRLDEISASQNLRHFLNLLNRAYFGSAARRYNKSVEVIPALERSRAGRLHYHLAIRNPYPERRFFIEQRIKDCWAKTQFADAETKIQQSYDVSGWHKYLTKMNRDNIDWENYHTA